MSVRISLEGKMSWNCPNCKKNNPNETLKCSCGYAYYEILGTKEDTDHASVEQTYQYLIKVWRSTSGQGDNKSNKKSDERLRKIEEAHAVFRQISKRQGSSSDKTSVTKLALGLGGAVILIAAGFLLFYSKKEPVQPVEQSVPSSPIQQASPAAQALPVQPTQSQTSAPSVPEKIADRPDPQGNKSAEWAVDMVKKSNALDSRFSAETIVNKWIQENSDKLKAIGWISKKVDEKHFLVTYTATDGVTPKGFYFELNTDTDEIKNIANHPDLQQKYGIRGN